MIVIDMSNQWNEAAAWYALARLVEEQGEEGERCRGADHLTAESKERKSYE